MSDPKVLQPHEIRVIKIDKKAILELLGEIFSDISHEKFQLPHNKNICIDWFYDDKKNEVMLFAYNRKSAITKERIIAYIKNLSTQATQSLLARSENKKYYCSVKNSVSNSSQLTLDSVNLWETLLAKTGIRVQPLKKYELRIIRLRKEAIDELLWEHFMQTGNKVMNIPEEDSDDFQIIYHFMTKGNLEELILYVMNINEASDEAFIKNSTYCEKNIAITTDSYTKTSSKEQKYVSVILQ